MAFNENSVIVCGLLQLKLGQIFNPSPGMIHRTFATASATTKCLYTPDQREPLLPPLDNMTCLYDPFPMRTHGPVIFKIHQILMQISI